MTGLQALHSGHYAISGSFEVAGRGTRVGTGGIKIIGTLRESAH